MYAVSVNKKQFLYWMLDLKLVSIGDRGRDAIHILNQYYPHFRLSQIEYEPYIDKVEQYLNKNVSKIVESYIDYTEYKLAEYIYREFCDEDKEDIYGSGNFYFNGWEIGYYMDYEKCFIGYDIHKMTLDNLREDLIQFIKQLNEVGFEVREEDFIFINRNK